MKLWLPLVAAMALIMALPACKKAGSNNSEIPHINFLALQPDSVRPGSLKDTLYLSFDFTDGNGDLGNDPASGNYDVFLKDSRDTAFPIMRYFFPPIPDDARDPIEGLRGQGVITIRGVTIPIRTDTLHALHGDTLTLDMWIKDQAGHSSDTITTTPIHISGK